MTQCPKCRNGISPGKPCPYCAASEEAQQLEDERLAVALERLATNGRLRTIFDFMLSAGVVTRPTRFLAGQGAPERVEIKKGGKA